ncbi:dephospho-CoA kinase-domain-containing protein [Geopyxis carbonaria]|nr:dephospho-CoA kinase-domain-containing protein [Geopyxis carbonaria]
MLVLGLTGSIATGKSTVANLLRSHDLPIIDADVLARLVVARGTPGFAAIVRHFAPTTPDLLTPAGDLDRAALGHRVFGDSEQVRKDRAVLNGIVHPAVRRAMATAVAKAWLRGEWCVVVDVPLLFEAGLDMFCGGVLVVATSEETQLRRLVERDGRGEEEARSRVQSQMRVGEKVERAKRWGSRGWVVDNDGSREELEKRVATVVRELAKGRKGWWTRLLWLISPLGVLVGIYRVLANWVRLRETRRRVEEAKAKL